MMPRPPNLAGKAIRSQIALFGGALPVRDVSRMEQIQTSRGQRREFKFKTVLHRKENLCTKP